MTNEELELMQEENENEPIPGPCPRCNSINTNFEDNGDYSTGLIESESWKECFDCGWTWGLIRYH